MKVSKREEFCVTMTAEEIAKAAGLPSGGKWSLDEVVSGHDDNAEFVLVRTEKKK